MNNLQLTYTPYTTKLKKPFETSNTTITNREGFILILKSEMKYLGIGEAAPLPEFGSETFEEDEKALENFNLKLRIDLGNIEKSIKENLKDYDNLPSLKCGLELAILKLLCSEKKTSIPALLKRDYPEFIFVNGVLGFTPITEVKKTATDFVKEGLKTIKIKVGRDDFKKDLNTIKEIRNAAGKGIKIRIDANAKWDKDEAIEHLNELEQYNIEYAEQPVKDLDDFLFLKGKTKIPLAADESIRSMKDAKGFVNNKAVSFLILKPMMLGGILPTLKIADFAKEHGIQTIVTSSFESVIGRVGVVNAAALINNDLVHGLGTGNYFDEQNLPDPFPVSGGKILFGTK
jgi:o-succinylbenzoate synthase